jgi:hypothetical protein
MGNLSDAIFASTVAIINDTRLTADPPRPDRLDPLTGLFDK